ncbi:MAG: YihA family ribosome biogenesis GTP-binding protein [Paludibacteraceae bacterium]|nr:YihA family ribosome biogenesis GTP-binding protein [Paludibacteraceae bacterium]
MIKYANFVISSPDVAQCPQSTLPEYAFIGRSNVGKSSLINALCHNPKLAKTSQKPGKTLLINHFLIDNRWHLVDLPGYGFAQAGKSQREKLRRMIERYCLLRDQLTNLFVLIDCRHEPQKIDLEFMNWLGEQGVPFSIVFTKADKLGKERLAMNIEAYKDTLLGKNTDHLDDSVAVWDELPPIFITSSEKNTGTDELLAYIEQINATFLPPISH